MKDWKSPGGIIVASILLVTQYILAFFVFKLPGWKPLQGVGWVIWAISVIFGVVPIFTFHQKGGVARGNSYVKTTRLVDTGLYAIVRHPQYMAGILFNLAMMLLAQHWLVILLGILSMILIYLDIQAADQEGIEKFGDAYRQYMQRVPQVNMLLGIFRLFRPKTEVSDPGLTLVRDVWNDSVTGDFLWTNSNFCEAICDVMTPATRSMWDIYLEAIALQIPGYPLVGVIGGRPYINMSLLLSFGRVIGMDTWKILRRSEDLWGRVPEKVDVPQLPLSNWQILRLILPGLIKVRGRLRVKKEEIKSFVDTCPEWCIQVRGQIQQAGTPNELAALWRHKIHPYFGRAWTIVRATLESGLIGRLRRELIDMVGVTDANTLLSNLRGSEQLASLGPLIGLSKMAHSQMSREEYLREFGHRGPHEMELSFPRPAEDELWLDRQLASYAKAPVDVEKLLRNQRMEFEAAWERFVRRYPRRAKTIHKKIERAAASTRQREAVRSEATRIVWVIRDFALRASALAGFENRQDVFFLSLDEMTAVLSGENAGLALIPARKEMHALYSALPPYPAIIIGHFDPFKWAADPNRRSDLFDAHAPATRISAAITGFSGAAGEVEGMVRRLDSPEEGDQLLPGEILVATTTNVGWTPLFPRAAAVITDVGAPLSHAAIVARELGIPAVVGCGNATMRLHTGDRVRVDGGKGIVEILQESNS
jgi:protein-S-isoprenylcysteine O-methyltransferase Ste14/phosphohistidine swiveling domain-containing protein